MPSASVVEYIVSLPEKMAEHKFVGWLTDIASEAASKWFGVRIPGLEGIISRASFFPPAFAVVSLLYLYHNIYISAFRRVNSLIVEKRPRSVKQTVFAVLTTIYLLYFVAGKASEFYYYHEPASASLKYSDLSLLADFELRERAFAVVKKLTDLENDYRTKQQKVNEPYEIELAEWNKKS
jgi:hypothetical protein